MWRRPACSTQNRLAFASAQAADRRRPLRKATHAAVSSVSAAIENDVECGLGARKALCEAGAEGCEQWQETCVATPCVVPQSTSASARSARGVGPGRSVGRAGMCRRSAACVRSAGTRGRRGELESTAGSNNSGSEANVARLER
eukprot:6088574-Pleurochrysis_carterae.AAC.1